MSDELAKRWVGHGGVDVWWSRRSARADIYRGSDEDFAWIWPGRDPVACASQIVEAGAAIVIMTRGGEGATVFSADGEVDVVGRPVEVIDTVGAGDTFVACVLVQLDELGLAGTRDGSRELSAERWGSIAETAVVASSITCSRLDADPPTKADLMAALDS